MTTEQLASKLGLRPHTLRTAYCLKGGYYGVKPTKLPNRHLHWPDDAFEQLTKQHQAMVGEA